MQNGKSQARRHPLVERWPPPPSRVTRRALLRLGLGATAGCLLPGCRSRRHERVIVVGGGLSGLVTALLLEDAGINVTLIEGRRRLGGQLWTLADLPGRPEAGGGHFDGDSPRVLTLLERLGLKTQGPTTLELGQFLFVRGQGSTQETWANSPGNMLRGAERSIAPSALLETYLGEDECAAGARGWRNPALAGGDVCLRATLEERGASGEALRLIQVAEGGGDLGGISTIWAEWRQQRRRRTWRAVRSVIGGTAALVEALDGARVGETIYGRKITRLESTATGVKVVCSCGKSYTADRCVLAIPYSTLRAVDIEPAPEGAQAEAIRGLPAIAVTRYFLRPLAPFWEQDGLPPAMWTDGPVERVFAHLDDAGEIVLLSCVVNGEAARSLDRLSHDDQERIVLDAITAARPASAGKLELLRIVSWERDPFARGGTAFYAPGQVGKFARRMSLPWHRFHFAGAHTAVEAAGIEGAIESAERVAAEVHDALG